MGFAAYRNRWYPLVKTRGQVFLTGVGIKPPSGHIGGLDLAHAAALTRVRNG